MTGLNGVFNRLLMPAAQIPRLPLQKWASGLADRANQLAARSTSAEFEHASLVTNTANNAALVLTHGGLVDSAEAVCRSQCAWLADVAERHGCPELRMLLIQPWVNLGRLCARTCRTEQALSCFADVLHCTTSARPAIAGFPLNRNHWAYLEWDAAAGERFGRTVYIKNSLDALLLARRYEDVVSFAAANRHLCQDNLRAFALEAEMIARARLGEREQAIGAEQRDRPYHPWARIVFRVRSAQALAMADEDLDRANSIIGALLAVMQQLAVAEKATLPYLLVVMQAVRTQLALRTTPAACHLASDLAAAADRLDDEVLMIEALQSLCLTGAVAESARLQGLLRQTGYCRFASAEVAQKPVPPEIVRMSESVFAMLDVPTHRDAVA